MLASLNRFLQYTLAALMLALVATVTWQVLSRHLLSSPSSWTEELARFLLIWIGVLGASYAFREKQHLSIDLLLPRLHGASAFWLRAFINVVVLAFALTVLFVGGASLVQLTWELKQYSAALGIPMAFVYSVVPLSGLLIVAYAIEAIVQSWHEDFNNKETAR